MKSRKLILASAAFVFAIGGAIASSLIATPVFVKARLEQNGTITCVNTGVSCESTGSLNCSVSVPTSSTGGSSIATTTGTFKTYNASDCENVLKNNTTGTIASSVQTYQLVP